MSSILMAAVLSGAGSSPGQWAYWGGGCCGGYAPAYYVAADDSPRKRRGHHHHRHGHSHGGLGGVMTRLQAIEKRLDAMDAKRDVEKLVEQRIKEERVRNELKELREKVQNLELDAKLKKVENRIEAKERMEKLEKRVGDIENMLKKLFERLRDGGGDKKPKFFRDKEEAQEVQTNLVEETVERTQQPAQPARIIVTLPAGAKLYIGKTRIHGSSFRTPPLENGTYSYDLRVQWFEDGQLRQHVRTVSFEPGTETYVHLDDLNVAWTR